MYENEIYPDIQNNALEAVTEGGKDNGMGGGKKKKGTVRKVVLSMGLGLTFGVFAGAGFYAVRMGVDYFAPAQIEEEVSGEENTGGIVPTGLTGGASQVTYVKDDVSEMVEDVMPAMVSVMGSFTQEITTFWGPSYTRPTEGAGSGIIVAENNDELLIVTNNHVVEGAQELKVSFIDGTTATARIKGLDSDMDLAVISVSLADLSQETRNSIAIARLGDSDSLKLGMPVIAIGNALGYGQSVTGGYISALNREVVMEDGTKGTFIQTDAAINSGNSGGALVNAEGLVVGINSSKIAATDYEGMGFAIPSTVVQPIVSDLIEYGYVKDRPMLGIMGGYVDRTTASFTGLSQGYYVSGVVTDNAKTSGLQMYDVITAIDDVQVTSAGTIASYIASRKPGDTVKLTVDRALTGQTGLEIELVLSANTGASN